VHRKKALYIDNRGEAQLNSRFYVNVGFSVYYARVFDATNLKLVTFPDD